MGKHGTEKVVMDFVNSNSPTDKVVWDDDEFSSVKSACSNLRSFIKKCRVPVRVMVRKGTVYLVRK